MRCRSTSKATAPGASLTPGSPIRFPDVRRRVRQGRAAPLARACDARPGLRVHDALAGWGTDGLVLAGWGCRVHMSERHPEVFAILDARLRDVLGDEDPVSWAFEDARRCWRDPRMFDVVYLDPMFGRHPKTALPAKRMQVLAELVPDMADGEVCELIDRGPARRLPSGRGQAPCAGVGALRARLADPGSKRAFRRLPRHRASRQMP